MVKDAALLKAIEAVGASAIAVACGITRQGVSDWKRVPPGRVLTVEQVSGVPRHELRPDIFPPPEAVADGKADAA